MNLLLTVLLLLSVALTVVAQPDNQLHTQLRQMKDEIFKQIKDHTRNQQKEIEELKQDKVENMKLRKEYQQLSKSFQEQLDAASMNMQAMREQLQAAEESTERFKKLFDQKLATAFSTNCPPWSQTIEDGKGATEIERRVVKLEENQLILEQQLLVFDSKLVVTQSQVVSINNELSNVESNVHEMENEMEIMDERLDEVDNCSTNSSADGRLDDVESQLNEQQQVADGMSEELSKLQRIDQEMRTAMNSLTGRVKAVESRNGIHYSFLASLTSNINFPQYALVPFDRVHHNRGSGYNSSSGEYTVPVDGVYMFSTTLRLRAPNAHVYFYVDEVRNTGSRLINGDADYFTLTATSQFELTAGQRVSVHIYDVTHIEGFNEDTMWCWFSGHLVET